jgi:undecaprenyl-diphosphatase
MEQLTALDWQVFYAFNAWVGRNFVFDQTLAGLADWNLFRGGWLYATIWWLWFRTNDYQQRAALLSGMVGLYIATLSSVILQRLLNVHARPFVYAAEKAVKLPATLQTNWGEGNSFPSDTATLYFSVVAILFSVSRRLGWIALAWVMAIICLPRIYLTYHFPSDIVGGGLLAIGCASAAKRLTSFRQLGVRTVEWSERNPHFFYPLAFLGCYQAAEAFGGLNYMLKGLEKFLHIAF